MKENNKSLSFHEFARKAIDLIHEPRVEKDYFKELERLFDLYEKLYEQIEVIAVKNEYQGTKRSISLPSSWVCSALLSIVKDYLAGNLLSAHHTMQKVIFEEASILGPSLLNSLLELKESTTLYRGRKKSHGLPFTKNELLHIPFSLRHKVENLRYSISGLPSLYLGSDSYTCWEELNRPEFSKVAFIGFKLKKDLKLLDLRIPELKEEYTPTEQMDLQVQLPMILAITRKVLYPNNPFKPEYIISQIISQLVREQPGDNNEFHGIAFSSSKVDHQNNSPLEFYNVFIPTLYNQQDYSPIVSEYFEVSEPHEWEVLQALSPFPALITANEPEHFAANLKKLVVDHHTQTRYAKTRWGELDHAIYRQFKQQAGYDKQKREKQ